MKGSEEGGAGRGDELFLDVGGVGGEAAQEVGRGGRGDGEGAVGTDDHAAADVDGRAVPGADLEVVDAGARGDNVYDCVHGSDFVEVDVVHGDVVDFGFGGAEKFEGANGGLLDFRVERGGLDEGFDLGEGAAVGVFFFWMDLVFVGVGFVGVGVTDLVLMLGLGLKLMGVLLLLGEGGFGWGSVVVKDVDLGGGDAAAVYFFYAKGGPEVEGGSGFVEDLWGDSGVEESAEEHVSSDAGETV